MATSAQGIVEKGAMFRGVVRSRDIICITLLNEDDKIIPYAKCKVTFQDGQMISEESDDDGVLKILRKTEGEFEIALLEEEEGTESSEGEAL